MHPVVKSVAKPVFWAAKPLLPKGILLKFKEFSEYNFWKELSKTPAWQNSDHYQFFYTEFFGLPLSWYEGKKVIDIGCGPRGSLEWADVASRRVGLDPLVDRYRNLGIDKHKMEYSHAPVEKIPFADGTFDVVTSLNSLDHVEDIDDAIAEMTRVLAVGGSMVLIVEVNHRARPTEPVEIFESALKTKLSKRLMIKSWRAFPIRYDHDIYRSLRESEPVTLPETEPGIVAVLLEKAA